MFPIARRFLMAVFFVVAASNAARADKLTKAEIGRRGKAATAFVDVGGKRGGTAFCVHPSGLFLTNEHVVRGHEKDDIKCVVDAGQPTQRIFTAKVVRFDKALDLALLQVSTKDALPSLRLGSVEGLAELVDVYVFGFPLGTALAGDRKEYPAISVNAGTVASLRKKNGALDRVQIDASVTFGSSGGPVLGDDGKILGVVVSGVIGQRGVSMAIPVSHVVRFLDAPDIRFTLPEVTRATIDREVDFKAQAVSFVPGRAAPTLRLILQAEGEKAREFPMIDKDGTFSVRAAPVGQPLGRRVELSIRMGSGLIVGLVNDSALKIGDRAVKLSAIRRIDLKPKPSVWLADGNTVNADVAGLGTADIVVGDEIVKFDLSKATQIQVMPGPEIIVVTAAVVATVNGKDVARTEARIVVQESATPAPSNQPPVAISPPKMNEEQIVKLLPEPYDDVRQGGGGRYLVFHLPKLRKLAVFDITESRITGYIPHPEGRMIFAAGLRHVIVGLPDKGALERWNIASCELEATVYPKLTEELRVVLMGHAASDSLVVNGRFFDPETFRPLPIVNDKGHDVVWDPVAYRYPSADGMAFGAWNTHYSPATSTTFVVEGNVVRRYDEGDLRHVIPGPDSTRVFTGKGVRTSALKGLTDADNTAGYTLPAAHGNSYLSLSSAEGTYSGGLSVRMIGESRTIANLPKFGHGLRFDGWDREVFGPWQRVYWIPQANVIAVLPPSNDKLVLHKFDMNAALEQSGIDYLFVESQGPRTAKAGSKYTYPIGVRAKHAPVTFQLDSGPKGMEIAKDGVLTWTPALDAPAGNQQAILTIRDSRGQEIFHTLTIRVTK